MVDETPSSSKNPSQMSHAAKHDEDNRFFTGMLAYE